MKWLIVVGIIISEILLHATLVHGMSTFTKLPYSKGQSFIVTQGYNALPTHIKKDSYALDFTQNGCDAYAKAVVAARDGKAMMIQEQGYNGGYGTEIVIDHGNDIVSRYAHLIPGSIELGIGQAIRQGQTIGRVGNTGLVAGLACAVHPGTHLHFAMDIRDNDGTLRAFNPEPISGYGNITEGRWYLSDNIEQEVRQSNGSVLGATIVATDTFGVTQATTTIISSTSAITQSPPPPSFNMPIGGVAVVPSILPMPAVSSTSNPVPEIITSTSSVVSSTPSAIVQASTLFAQGVDSELSGQSFYDDNWYDLGSGLAGTVTSLMLEGRVSSQDFFASHISLQEFKDQNYTAMIQQFTISDNASLTYQLATATFNGLSILLKPYFYYRLATIQDYQNRSVILAGTSATGTMMSDNFIYGVGRVESTSSFMPFMVLSGFAPTSTMSPPPITSPSALMVNFDPLAMSINLAWATSTDPDWSLNPIHYEINYSTSSILDNSRWGASLPIPVILGNSYLIGIRATDNFGDFSTIATTSWSFPPGFIPYSLSEWTNYATQDFKLPVAGTLRSIEVFTTNFGTGSRNPDTNSCDLSLFDYDTLLSYWIVSADNGYSGYGCGGHLTFSFGSSSPQIVPNHRYQWLFQLHDFGPSARGGVQFYGTASDTAGGRFSDPSIKNARFIINGSDSTLFAN